MSAAASGMEDPLADRLYNFEDVESALRREVLPVPLADLGIKSEDIMKYTDLVAHDLFRFSLIHRAPRTLKHQDRRPGFDIHQQQHQMQQQGSGYCVKKPYNTILNWKKLLSNIPENALIVGGPASASWMMIVAALVLVGKMLDLSTVELTPDQATIMLVLAAAFGPDRAVPEAALKSRIDQHLEQSRLPLMSETAFHRAVDDLHQLRSVELAGGQVRLVEVVPVQLVEHVFVDTR